MLKRVAGWYRERRRGTRLLLATLTLCVIIGGVYWGLREVSIRIADHMTITVTRIAADPGGPAGSVVYQHTFGRALAADAEHLLNDETTIYTVFNPPPDREPLPNGTGPYYHYHLAFTWQGILVETVDVTSMTAPEFYSISALGLVTPWQVQSDVGGTPYSSVISQLALDSGGAIPSSK